MLTEGEHSGFHIWDIKFTLACVNSVTSVVLALFSLVRVRKLRASSCNFHDNTGRAVGLLRMPLY